MTFEEAFMDEFYKVASEGKRPGLLWRAGKKLLPLVAAAGAGAGAMTSPGREAASQFFHGHPVAAASTIRSGIEPIKEKILSAGKAWGRAGKAATKELGKPEGEGE